jgi:hypothetical protein
MLIFQKIKKMWLLPNEFPPTTVVQFLWLILLSYLLYYLLFAMEALVLHLTTDFYTTILVICFCVAIPVIIILKNDLLFTV